MVLSILFISNEGLIVEIWDEIEECLVSRDIKRGELLIAKLMKQNLDQEQQSKALLIKSKFRLMASRPNDVIEEILHILPGNRSIALQETLADSYLQRFEISSVGFAQKSDLEEALKIYNLITEKEPFYENRGWIYYQTARIYLALPHASKAENLLNMAIFSPSHVQPLVAFCFERLAFIQFYEKRDAIQATTLIQKAIDTYPESAPKAWLVQVYLFKCKILQGTDLKKAMVSAKDAFKLAEIYARNLLPETLLLLADLSSQEIGKNRDVVEYLQLFFQLSKSPLGIDVTWSRACELLGNTYVSLGKHENAISAYYEALRYNPYHPWENDILYKIANCYYYQSQFGKANDILKSLISKGEASWHLYELMGHICYATDRHEEAEQNYTLMRQHKAQ